MKKLILLSAVLLGTAVASQAGVHVDIGLPLPLLPVPRVIVPHVAPVYPQARVYVEPEYCPPPVVYAPPPVYYAPRHYYYPSHHYGHGYDRGHYDHGHDNHWSNHGGHHR